MNHWPRNIVRTSGLAVVALALGLAVGGCSSKSSGTGTNQGSDSTPDAATVGCTGEGDTYSANMEKPGENGKFTFTLVEAAPAPPSLDGNVWTVKVVDGSGKAPTAGQLTAFPYMPKMGHGSSQVPQIAANPDGTFTVSDVYLFMDGLWTVTFSVAGTETDGGAKPVAVDSAVYTFCIDD